MDGTVFDVRADCDYTFGMVAQQACWNPLSAATIPMMPNFVAISDI